MISVLIHLLRPGGEVGASWLHRQSYNQCSWMPIVKLVDVLSENRTSPLSQQTHDVIITSLLRQNRVATSLWFNTNVIIASRVVCVCVCVCVCVGGGGGGGG